MSTGERGDMNLETAVGGLALIVLFGLALVAMRVQTAESAVDEAARSAARSASLARDGAAAESRARAVLAEQQLTCSSLTVVVDATDFAKPLGERGYVVATVTCEVPLADLAIPGIGGTKTTTAQFRSPIDRYGARQ